MVTDFKKQGKKNRLKGKKFEVDTYKKFSEEGWAVTKWRNQIDLQTDEIIPAKNHYLPGRGNVMGSGFPDFVMFRIDDDFKHLYEVMFVECKISNKLDKTEKLKMQALKNMGHNVYIAYLEDKEIMLREFEGYENKT